MRDTKAVLESLGRGNFRLDSLHIIVEKNDPEASRVFSGAGYVEQSGQLEFRLHLYHLDEQASLDLMASIAERPGEMIREESFYNVQIRDAAGDLWLVDQVLPDVSPVIRSGAFVAARFRQIRRSVATEVCGPVSLRLWAVGVDGVPWTAATHSQKEAFGRMLERTGRLNRTRVSVAGIDVELFDADPWLGVELTVEDRATARIIEARLAESMQFVLGRSVQWVLTERRSGSSSELLIALPHKMASQLRMDPPLSKQHCRDQSNDFGRMLTCHFEHGTDLESAGWSQLSKAIYMAIEAGSGTQNTRALVLPVAIERVLRSYFEDVFPVPHPEIELVEQAVEEVRASSLDERMKERLIGALGSWRHPSAGAMLRRCAEAGIINNDEEKAWKKTRHPNVHGDARADDNLDQQVYRCASLTVLLYKLCFAVIAYQGHYTDYGTIGHPLRLFDAHLPELAEPELGVEGDQGS